MENNHDMAQEALRLDNQLCFALYAASRKVIALYTPLLNKLGITYTQYITLLVLWENHTTSVKELCNKLMLDTGTMTPLLKKMEDKGYITRTRSPLDERSVIISITTEGKNLKDEAEEFLPQIFCSLDTGVEELVEVREGLKRLLGRIV